MMLQGASSLFFFKDTATTSTCTLSRHGPLPTSLRLPRGRARLHRLPRPLPLPPRRCAGGLRGQRGDGRTRGAAGRGGDRKSTRLNSSHANISYAVFCLKKKKHTHPILTATAALL